MANKILVFLEQRSGNLKKSSLETVSTAVELGSKLNIDVDGIVIGNVIENPESAGNYGLNKLTYVMSPDLENYSPSAYTDLVAQYAKEINADILLFSNTALGKDLAPRVAVKLDAGILTDCVKLDNDSGAIIATRPIYAGKALQDAKINSKIKIFTLRPNVFGIKEVKDQKAQVTVKDGGNLNLSSKVIEIKKAEGKLDVAEADIIVSGGRGLKGPENYHLVEELAQTLGAAVGASRAVVDAGWRPHSEQVGQTGKTVSPNLYVAVGISGAIQHLAGMSSSKYIVAINKDKDAPIFGIADYGIAGDIFEVVPELISEIKKQKNA